MEERIRVIKKRERRRSASSPTAWRPESVGGPRRRRRRRRSLPRVEAGLSSIRKFKRMGSRPGNAAPLVFGLLIFSIMGLAIVMIVVFGILGPDFWESREVGWPPISDPLDR